MIYTVPDHIQNSSLQKVSQPAKISHKAVAGLCTFLAIASQQSGNLLDYDWYKRVIRLPLVHTAPSLELLAQTPSNFNLWYWFNDASRQYCCSNAFRALPNCEAHNSGTSCFIQRSHREFKVSQKLSRVMVCLKNAECKFCSSLSENLYCNQL